MIYVNSLGRAARFYSRRTALAIDGRSLTFLELEDRVAGIAATLIELGFKRGDRLALLLPNGPEYIELVYACSWIGLIAVPLNTRWAAAEIDHALRDAGPCGLIRHSSLPAPTVPIPQQRVLDKEPWEFTQGSQLEVIYDPEAILALIYTSGTTGKSKGVMLTHSNVFANVHNLGYWMRYHDRGVYLHAAPIFHIADFPAMFAAPAFGATQVTIPKFSPPAFCETVEREHVSHTVLVPTMINLLMQFPDLKKYDLSSLEVLAYGGSPMAPQLVRQTRSLLPNVKLVQVYGLSETGFLSGLQDHEHTDDKLLSCGKPCPGVDLQTVDESGNVLRPMQQGELVARGANVMCGYWHNEAETRRSFRNGLFRTGDIGYRDEDGYFFIMDRLKDMIVTGGENVYCGEVEAVIYEHPSVREVAVFGIPDAKWGELVMACVVLKSDLTLTLEDLVAYCTRRLATYKVPRRVEFLTSELPKNGSGKIIKSSLRERFWSLQKRAVG